jgi:hypothetical protein
VVLVEFLEMAITPYKALDQVVVVVDMIHHLQLLQVVVVLVVPVLS